MREQIEQLLDDYRAHAPLIGRFGMEYARQLAARGPTAAEQTRTTEPYPDQELEIQQVRFDQGLSKS